MERKEEIKAKFSSKLLELLEVYSSKNNVRPSLRKLSNRSNLEYSHVQRISKGKVDISLTTLISLAEGLEVDPKDLLDF
jgi:DNA-binding Xre family transcriptional regulator